MSVVEREPVTTIPEVERGAAWLDENVPGWWEWIQVERLDLRQCDLCICGQLLATLELDQEISHFLGMMEPSYGFDADDGAARTQESWLASYRDRQLAWEEEILRRRGAT